MILGRTMFRVVFLGGAAILVAFGAEAQPQTIEEKAMVCAGCHGEKGAPEDRAYPVIWGQHRDYLHAQLAAFKSGARKDDFMTPVAAELSPDDLAALADYFSKKSWPDLGQKPAPAAEATTANRINVSIGCTACHLGEYRGDASVPRLAGQSHDYLLKTMRDFRSGVRGNNPGMTALTKAMAEADFDAEADFLAGR